MHFLGNQTGRKQSFLSANRTKEKGLLAYDYSRLFPNYILPIKLESKRENEKRNSKCERLVIITLSKDEERQSVSAHAEGGVYQEKKYIERDNRLVISVSESEKEVGLRCNRGRKKN